MPIPAKNIIRQRDLRIAKVGKNKKPFPCASLFGNYLENLRSGHDSNVPKSIVYALQQCAEEWERVISIFSLFPSFLFFFLIDYFF